MGKWWLAPAAYLYKLGVTFRHRLFDWGVLRSETFPVPVICIGNITVGGTGKTPMAEPSSRAATAAARGATAR